MPRWKDFGTADGFAAEHGQEREQRWTGGAEYTGFFGTGDESTLGEPTGTQCYSGKESADGVPVRMLTSGEKSLEVNFSF